MKERPILFTPENAQKCFEGKKTQTRRIIKPQPDGEPRSLLEWSSGLAAACHDHSPDPIKLAEHANRLSGKIFPFARKGGGLMSPSCPYGVVGDRLWVREKHWRCELEGCGIGNGFLVYDDEFQDGEPKPRERRLFPGEKFGPLPSIHMPRWACRTVLEITEIRVERLQAISVADCLSEGVGPRTLWEVQRDVIDVIGHYRSLWESINGSGSWNANPWVWALTFRKVA